MDWGILGIFGILDAQKERKNGKKIVGRYIYIYISS